MYCIQEAVDAVGYPSGALSQIQTSSDVWLSKTPVLPSMVLEPVITLVPWPPNAECPPADVKVGARIIAADSKRWFISNTKKS